jgi:outer membrane lipase/esterase
MLKKLSRLFACNKKQISVAISTLMLCGGLATTAQAIPFGQISQVIFFGDSLTDGGFNDQWGPGAGQAPLPVGKAATFTTFGGYTWAQYVARDVKGFSLPVGSDPNPNDLITNNAIPGLPFPGALFVSGLRTGINYACAGATTNSTGNAETWAPSLTKQVNYYLSNHVVDPNAVYFVFAGANDLLTLLPTTPGAPQPSQVQLLMAANTAANNIGNSVAQLAASGATRIVVLSLPNIGVTPLATALATAGGMPTLPASLKNVTFTFNSMLNTQLGKVIAKYNTKILYVDVYDLLNNVILATQAGKSYVVAGQTFTFANYTTPACAAASSAIYCPSTAPTNYVFADVIHPSDMAHRVLSLQVETQLQNWS